MTARVAGRALAEAVDIPREALVSRSIDDVRPSDHQTA
jgi:hypothetical protein